jgi:hypothetical protein
VSLMGSKRDDRAPAAHDFQGPAETD